MKHSIYLLLSLALLSNQQDLPQNPIIKELWNVELAFSKSAAAIGLDGATYKFVDDQGILFKPHPVRAKEWIEQGNSQPVIVKTYPVFVDASAQGDFGYVIGVFDAQGHEPLNMDRSYGFFATVWTKGSSGIWKGVLGHSIGLGNKGLDQYKIAPEFAKPYQTNSGSYDLTIVKNELISMERELLNRINNDPFGTKFTEFLTSEAWVIRDGEIPTQEISKVRQLINSHRVLSWTNINSAVSPSGDMGYTYGSINFEKDNETIKGYYMRVWKRQENGQWKIALDLFNNIK